MTILLFCGPARAGKTSLAMRLARLIKLPYMKFPSSIKPGWAMDDPRIDLLSRTICECIEELSMHFNFILDRAWPDNIVYGRLFNRKIVESHYFENMSVLGDSLQVFYITAALPALQSRMLETGLKTSPSYDEIFRNVKTQLDIWTDVVATMRSKGIIVYDIDNSDDIELAYNNICKIAKGIELDKF